MHIIEEMQYIQNWSKSLLDICNTLEKMLDSWDSTFPENHRLNSDLSGFDRLTLEEIASAVFTSDWDQSLYEKAASNIHFNEEAHQLIHELELYTEKLENAIGKLPDMNWKSTKHRIKVIRLLAERGLKLSTLPTK